jgi:hypothetical protein
MARGQRVLQTVLRNNADSTIAFSDLSGLLRGLGIDERIRGHCIFSRSGVAKIVNLSSKGFKSKSYQVKQVS